MRHRSLLCLTVHTWKENYPNYGRQQESFRCQRNIHETQWETTLGPYHHIYDSQFGALAGTCASDTLVEMFHKWYEATVVTDRFVRVLFLDYWKAFDLIYHDILISKLVIMELAAFVLCSFYPNVEFAHAGSSHGTNGKHMPESRPRSYQVIVEAHF